MSGDDGRWWARVPPWMGATQVNYEGKWGLRWWALRCYNGEWEAVTVGEGYSPVGPIAQRWLDNDAPLVTGLPWMYSEKRYGKLRDAAYIREHIERIRSLPTREGGVG